LAFGQGEGISYLCWQIIGTQVPVPAEEKCYQRKHSSNSAQKELEQARKPILRECRERDVAE